MCLVETREYRHPDGRVEVVEREHRCVYAIDNLHSLCSNVERRTAGPAQLEERRPVFDRNSDGLIVTQGPGGREKVYRDISRRISKRTSGRRSTNMARRNSISSSSPVSPASYIDVPPPAPSPPAIPASTLNGQRGSQNADSNDRQRTVLPSGTAVYSRPLSFEQPGKQDPNRQTRFSEPEISWRPSVKPNPPTTSNLPTRPRRSSMRINTGAAEAFSPAESSPGLSNLPKVSHIRNDSARDAPLEHPMRTQDEERAFRQQAEDHRQAKLERDRLAESDRRQEARDNARRAAREASRERRERHRQETADALDRTRKEKYQREQLAADDAQMARERAAAEQRRADSAEAERRCQDRLRQDAASRARYDDGYTRYSSSSPWRTTSDGRSPYTSPYVSPLGPLRAVTQPVQIHQYPSTRRDSTIRQRGEEVIAREQTRADSASRPQRAAQPLGTAFDPDAYGFEDYAGSEGYYSNPDMVRRRESRRMARYTDRMDEEQRFWR